MAQWGQERCFLLPGNNVIRVTPHVASQGFRHASGGDLVDDLHLTNVSRDSRAAVEFLDKLKEKFVGKPYADWLDARQDDMRDAAVPD